MLDSVGTLVLVSAIWGGTNPLIKRGTSGIAEVKSATLIGQVCAEFAFLLTNWKYVLPFCVNQVGSLIYYLCLPHQSLSIAVPLTNSLTFVFTALAGWLLGEEALTKRSLLGIGLIIAGISICYQSTLQT